MINKEGLLQEIHKGLLKWYDFFPKVNVLYVGTPKDDLVEILNEKGVKITCVSGENDIANLLPQNEQFFYYIIVVEIFETFRDVGGVFSIFSRLLQPEGKLLIGANNRLGLRFWCGERDLYAGTVLEGIGGYAKGIPKQGRMYSRQELKTMLRAAAFEKVRFYAVLPNLDYPMMIYREDFVPREDMANRLFPLYKSPDTLYLKEEALCDSIASEGVLPALANAYIIECSPRGDLQDVLQVTSSAERGRDNALLTIVRENNVEKRAFGLAGLKRLQTLDDNIRELKKHGIRTVEGELTEGKYLMPYVNAETGQKYLKNLLFTDKEKFVEEMDAFREMILNSSEHVNECDYEGEGVVLRHGYIDMIPLNTFRIGHDFVVFDQEFCQNDCPANFIITRMIFSFYAGNENFHNFIPVEFFLERYGLEKKLPRWIKMTDDFIIRLRNMNVLEEYTREHRRDDACLSANRARMNIPQCIYDKHIYTMLDKAAERKLILFGSGRFARSFLSRFGHEYSVYAIIDNNESRHGKELDGVKIYSPQILNEFSVAEYKIVICVKKYESIAEQLEKQGIFFYGIYNPKFNYSFPHLQRLSNTVPVAKKKYHIGYIAGVFDLFHIGHLNMFRCAKEQCHYLIVGVVSDRQVREGKKVEPFVPFEERMEMVKSCRYVDEVREIPYDYPDTDMAWKLYHFDVQFSGSDYENDPVWLKKKEWLEERGSTMVFFPYTQSTSSTRLKKLIEERLI